MGGKLAEFADDLQSCYYLRAPKELKSYGAVRSAEIRPAAEKRSEKESTEKKPAAACPWRTAGGLSSAFTMAASQAIAVPKRKKRREKVSSKTSNRKRRTVQPREQEARKPGAQSASKVIAWRNFSTTVGQRKMSAGTLETERKKSRPLSQPALDAHADELLYYGAKTRETVREGRIPSSEPHHADKRLLQS